MAGLGRRGSNYPAAQIGAGLTKILLCLTHPQARQEWHGAKPL
jgi:hypothetical protein